MKITLPVLLLCFLLSLSAAAQNPYSVKGSMIDSSSNSHLVNTTICVLNAKDSTLRKFTRATTTGSFAINNLPKGKYILLVSYPGYADYVEPFNTDSLKPEHDFGKVFMTLKSRLLQQVIIRGTAAAIKIKGDTTEFNAAAFKIEPNSKVEDLLKQLPGIQVDKDGKITAQGQTVPKVLVDGEEFFGDDPTLVTKNLRADMVDKVQLYDKKSDQAAFTGIDDGQKTKTINIKLKEDKKNGYFGKLDGGVGNDGYYSAQALFNAFKGKKKLSAYAITSNTGKVGLGWQDNDKYGSGNVQVDDSGNAYFSGGGGGDLDTFGGQYNGQGIPLARTGGIHYDNKWNTDKQAINANYKIGSLGVDGTTNNKVQNRLDSGLVNRNSDQTFHNSIFRQKLDLTYQTKLDTSSNLKVAVDGTVKNTKTRSNYLSTSTNQNDALLNNNNRTLDNNTNNQLFNASAFYTKKFKKVGRTISVNVSESVNNSDAKGYLNTQTEFYNKTSGLLDSTQTINQYKTTIIRSSVLNGNAVYTEPLSKKLSLALNYGVGVNNSSADRKSFNQITPGGAYDVLDTRYSNDYSLDQLSNQLGAILNYHTAKTTLNWGAKATDVNFKQTDLLTGIPYQRSFLNWNPQAFYQYKFTQQSSFRINYFGNTTQPTIDQIQPIRVNTDNLNIALGNPDLTPSFTNRFNIGYNSYKVLSDQYIGIYGSYNFTTNAIVNNTAIDNNTGKSTYQPVNLTDKMPYNFNINTYFNRKVTKLGIGAELNLSANGNVSYSYNNNVLVNTHSYTYSARLGFSKYVQKKYNFYTSAGPSYTVSGSTLQSQISNSGRGFAGYGGFNFYLPWKFQIGSDADYQYRGKTESFDESFSRMIINSNISKTFLKQDNLKFAISVNDLLNQNNGFDRSTSNGTISQNTYTTIRRYFLFSITWDFNKMGGAPQPKK